MHSSMLCLNDSKTEFIMFGSHHQLKNIHVTPSFKFASQTFKASDNVRDLGIIWDSNLSMVAHVNNVCKSAFFHLRSIAKIKKYLPQPVLTQLILYFITSRLDYGNSLLYGCSSSLLHKLQLVQNSAARLISNSRRTEHITPILKDLHWLPVEKRIIFKILLFTYRSVVHCTAPVYLSNLISRYTPSRTLRSGDSCQLLQPTTRTHFGDISFSASAPKLWNSLPRHLRFSPTLESFKRQLKTYLFDLHFSNN